MGGEREGSKEATTFTLENACNVNIQVNIQVNVQVNIAKPL